MANNYFFTGEKGIGKSTIVDAICENFNGKIGGFKTVKKTYDDGRVSFHFLDISKNEIPSEENILFYRYENKNENEIVKKFNKFSSTLDNYDDFDFIVMDEIGPNEDNAEIFKEKVLDVLNSDKYVIGVLQKSDTKFIKSIKRRNDTKVFLITKENRDIIKKKIIDIFGNEKN